MLDTPPDCVEAHVILHVVPMWRIARAAASLARVLTGREEFFDHHDESSVAQVLAS